MFLVAHHAAPRSPTYFAPCRIQKEPRGPWPELYRAAQDTVAGDTAGWNRLMHALSVVAPPIVRRQWRRLDPQEKFEQGDDVVHSVLVCVFQRLQRDGYRSLRASLDRIAESQSRPSVGVQRYFTVLLVRATIDYQRSHPLYRRTKRVAAHDRTGANRPNSAHGWLVPEVFVDKVGTEELTVATLEIRDVLRKVDGVARRARRIFLAPGSAQQGCRSRYEKVASVLGLDSWATARDLVQHGAQYRQALELMLQGYSKCDTGRLLGVSRGRVSRIVARAIGVAASVV